MNGSVQNEAKRQFVHQKAAFLVFILPTSHFEQILNYNIKKLKEYSTESIESLKDWIVPQQSATVLNKRK